MSIRKLLEEKSLFWIIEDYSIVKLYGNDVLSFLNSQTTNDVINLKNNKGLDNNLLDRKGHLISPFSLHKLDKYLIAVSQKETGNNLIEHLERYHFTEDFYIENISDNFKLLTIQGNLSDDILESLFNIYLEEENDIIKLNNNYIIKKSLSYEDGYLLILEINEFENIFNKLKNISYQINKDEIDEVRILSGIPLYGKDIDKNNIVSETGREAFSISYTKGCYLGQEVVARIKTYGTIPYSLIGVEIKGNKVPKFDSDIIINGKKVGKVKSSFYSNNENKVFSLVYLHKDFRIPDEKIHFISENQEFEATVRILPFIKKLSKQEKSKKLYDNSLVLFAENKEEEAIKLLKKSIKLNNKFSDAYEVLGVILSRLENYEEAIKVMNKLAEIAPDEPMARTNLSIFYMKIGNKEEAERQMTLATTLKFKKAMKESQQKKFLEDEKKKKIKEIEERIQMFKEVLETEDPNDLIANYGMGKSLFDLEKYNESIKYFQKAIDLKKDYSMAYLYLGKSFEFINDVKNAIETYKKGIVISSQKGDLMPLKEMEKRKFDLENNTST